MFYSNNSKKFQNVRWKIFWTFLNSSYFRNLNCFLFKMDVFLTQFIFVFKCQELQFFLFAFDSRSLFRLYFPTKWVHRASHHNITEFHPIGKTHSNNSWQQYAAHIHKRLLKFYPQFLFPLSDEVCQTIDPFLLLIHCYYDHSLVVVVEVLKLCFFFVSVICIFKCFWKQSHSLLIK